MKQMKHTISKEQSPGFLPNQAFIFDQITAALRIFLQAPDPTHVLMYGGRSRTSRSTHLSPPLGLREPSLSLHTIPHLESPHSPPSPPPASSRVVDQALDGDDNLPLVSPAVATRIPMLAQINCHKDNASKHHTYPPSTSVSGR